MRRFEGRGDGTMRQVCLALMCGFLLVVPGLTLADEGMAEGSALDPLGQSTDYEIGYDLLKAGRFLQAIEAFEKVIAADPTHAMAYTNMAYSFRRMGQYERAILEGLDAALAEELRAKITRHDNS